MGGAQEVHWDWQTILAVIFVPVLLFLSLLNVFGRINNGRARSFERAIRLRDEYAEAADKAASARNGDRQ